MRKVHESLTPTLPLLHSSSHLFSSVDASVHLAPFSPPPFSFPHFFSSAIHYLHSPPFPPRSIFFFLIVAADLPCSPVSCPTLQRSIATLLYHFLAQSLCSLVDSLESATRLRKGSLLPSRPNYFELEIRARIVGSSLSR